MTSSKPNNSWDDVMESVDKAIPADHHGAETPGNTPIDPPIAENAIIHARIKHDRTKEDSYLEAIAHLVMALAFMQEGKQDA